jgi:hypothetical protein
LLKQNSRLPKVSPDVIFFLKSDPCVYWMLSDWPVITFQMARQRSGRSIALLVSIPHEIPNLTAIAGHCRTPDRQIEAQAST